MNKQTIISVLMSIFNESLSDIRLSIDSILSQTITNFELIIINDNPDRNDYLGLLDEIKSQDDRVTIIHNPYNIGLAASMNKALTYAKGKYIARMDADDYSVPLRFEKELRVLCDSDTDVVFTNYTLIDADGIFLNNGEPICHIENDQDLTDLIVFNGLVHHPTVMIKKDILERVGGYRLFPCSQDRDLWIRILETGAKFTYIDEILLYYRVRQDSISQKKGFQQYVTIMYILHLLNERRKSLGLDHYSEKDYNKFIATQSRNRHEIKRFNTAMHYLKTAQIKKQDGERYKSFIYRISAFGLSKTLRRGYLFRLMHKKKILNYIERQMEKAKEKTILSLNQNSN